MNVKQILFSLAMLFTLASCGGGDDDFSAGGGSGSGGGSSTKEETFPYSINSTVTTLQTHTKGNGIPVVIMCDGYKQTDISSGTYHTQVVRAMNSLFCEEPMASLKEYFDVYEATAASSTSGITTTKGNTVFETYYVNKTSTAINGNDSIASLYAMYALFQTNGKSLAKAKTSLNDCVAIVLLNSNRYAGTTSIYHTKTAMGDSIATGKSIAYIPADARTSVQTYYKNPQGVIIGTGKKDTLMMNTLIQHEAVGHGLAKLADEYSTGSSSTTIPSAELEDMRTSQRTGCFLNVSASSKVTESPWARMAADSRYSAEELGCYEGAYTYSKGVYRPTTASIMREATTGFNAPCRMLIYRRAMKIANGSSWKFNYADFVKFDKLAGTASSAKGSGTTSVIVEESVAEALVGDVRVKSEE